MPVTATERDKPGSFCIARSTGSNMPNSARAPVTAKIDFIELIEWVSLGFFKERSQYLYLLRQKSQDIAMFQ